MDRFQNRYRIPSARAWWRDYSENGLYFITICSAHGECLFGAVRNGKMVLSAIGAIVQQEWKRSFDLRTGLFCEAFVIMPNHLHAILRIDKSQDDDQPSEPSRKDRKCGVAFRPPRSISSFVAGFKSAATKRVNEFRHMPAMPVWQSRFHDHIIRDDSSFKKIAGYIATNPLRWNDDVLKERQFEK